jgi:hypothetical protein
MSTAVNEEEFKEYLRWIIEFFQHLPNLPNGYSDDFSNLPKGRVAKQFLKFLEKHSGMLQLFGLIYEKEDDHKFSRIYQSKYIDSVKRHPELFYASGGAAGWRYISGLF